MADEENIVRKKEKTPEEIKKAEAARERIRFAVLTAGFVLLFAVGARLVTNSGFVHVISQVIAGVIGAIFYYSRFLVGKVIGIDPLRLSIIATIIIAVTIITSYLIFGKENRIQIVEIIKGDEDNRGAQPPPGDSFSVIANYSVKGYTGDIEDVHAAITGDSVIITYIPTGRGTHEWDYKCIDGKLSAEMAKFGGTIFLHPPNNYGQIKGGFYLRDFSSSITFEAKVIANRPIYVEFSQGGVTWRWKDCEKELAKYPSTLNWRRLGIETLADQWRYIQYSIAGIPKEEFDRVLDPLSCIISAEDNGIRLPLQGAQPDTIKVILRHIFYHKN